MSTKATATTSPAPEKVPGPTAIPALRITAKRESYYSARIQPAFTFEPREIALAELNDAQVAELRADPWLIVQDCEIKPAAATATPIPTP